MSISSRIGDIFRSNLNDLIDRAENPEKMIKQIIQDMQKELVKSRQALAQAIAGERLAEKQYQDAVQQAASWERDARAAAAAGDLQAARQALSQKIRSEESSLAYQENHAMLVAQTEKIRAQVQTLQTRLEEAKSRQAVLIARSQVARTRKQLAESVHMPDTADASEKLQRMEEQVLQAEAEADALAEMTETGSLERFEKHRTDARVDAALQQLLAELEKDQ